jgi:hypothetical protein
LLKRAGHVDDAGDADVLGGAGRGLNGNSAQGRGAALGKDDSIDAGSVRSAQEGAEVLGVFDTVECEEEAGGCDAIPSRRGGQEIFEIKDGLGANDRDDTLVTSILRKQGEVFAGLEAEAHAAVTAEINDSLKAFVVPFTGDTDVVKLAAGRTQRFFHRVQAVEDFHPSQFTCRSGDIDRQVG